MKDEKQPEKKSNKKATAGIAAIITAVGGAVAAILGILLPHMNKSEDNIIHHIHHNAPAVVAPKPEAVATPHIVSHNPHVPGDLLLIAINAIQSPGRKARAMQIFKHMTDKDISWSMGTSTINQIILEEHNDHH